MNSWTLYLGFLKLSLIMRLKNVLLLWLYFWLCTLVQLFPTPLPIWYGADKPVWEKQIYTVDIKDFQIPPSMKMFLLK